MVAIDLPVLSLISTTLTPSLYISRMDSFSLSVTNGPLGTRIPYNSVNGLLSRLDYMDFTWAGCYELGLRLVDLLAGCFDLHQHESVSAPHQKIRHPSPKLVKMQDVAPDTP